MVLCQPRTERTPDTRSNCCYRRSSNSQRVSDLLFGTTERDHDEHVLLSWRELRSHMRRNVEVCLKIQQRVLRPAPSPHLLVDRLGVLSSSGSYVRLNNFAPVKPIRRRGVVRFSLIEQAEVEPRNFASRLLQEPSNVALESDQCCKVR